MGIKQILTAFAAVLAFGLSASAADIQRMDPPFWYAGMKNHELQVMFYGKDIAASEFSLKDYPGVSVKEVAKVSNPNYLFVYLDISAAARPGTMTFQFKEGRKTTAREFVLRPRNTKKGAQGFTTKDVLYLIMPDRFSNGNPANDEWENFPVNRQNGGGHHGGDLQGIKEHLDYIDALGVTAVWLNPVQYNRSNASHGYAISDFYLIDPRLGSNEEYCEMIDAAHAKDIKVVMDMIFNHSGSSHWWIEDIPDEDWFNQNDYARSIGQRSAQQQKCRAGDDGEGLGRGGALNIALHQLPAQIGDISADQDADQVMGLHIGLRRGLLHGFLRTFDRFDLFVFLFVHNGSPVVNAVRGRRGTARSSLRSGRCRNDPPAGCPGGTSRPRKARPPPCGSRPSRPARQKSPSAGCR